MRSDFSKIFVLSRQKCATTSTGDFLRSHGISCAGADGNNNRYWGLLALARDYEKIFKSERFNDHLAFEDDPWWMNGMAEACLKRFPDGLYILVERDANEWFDSMLAHSRSRGLGFSMLHMLEYNRTKEYFHYLMDNRLLIQNENSFMLTEENRSHYVSFYERSIRSILDLFDKKNMNNRLCHVQINDPLKWQKIGQHLGLNVDESFDMISNRKSRRKTQANGLLRRTRASITALRLIWRAN